MNLVCVHHRSSSCRAEFSQQLMPLAINRVPTGSQKNDHQSPKSQLCSGPICRVASLQTTVGPSDRWNDERFSRADVIHQSYQIFIVTITAGPVVVVAAAVGSTVDTVRMVQRPKRRPGRRLAPMLLLLLLMVMVVLMVLRRVDNLLEIFRRTTVLLFLIIRGIGQFWFARFIATTATGLDDIILICTVLRRVELAIRLGYF